MSKDFKTFSLEELTIKIKEISGKWHKGVAKGDQGAGRTLEKLLGIEENNISLPDYGTIEIKSKIIKKNEPQGLISLFTKEPLPEASVPKLIKSMGWKHQNAGKKYSKTEQVFSSTINLEQSTNRGFFIDVTEDKIYVRFDPTKVVRNDPDRSRSKVYNNLGEWLDDIEKRKNPHSSEVMPLYYLRKDLEDQFIKKLNNTFFCLCRSKKINETINYQYFEGYILKDLISEKIASMFKRGLFIDFGARTNHNHGTKLRMKKENLFEMFKISEKIL